MTFDSFDDMKANILRMADALMPDAFTSIPEEEEHNTAPMPEPEEEHATAPTPEPEDPDRPGANVPKQPTAPEPEAPKPEKGLDLAQMRKILSAVNKHTGKNTARELIQAMGFKVLTEMPADKYPELKAKAEEVLNAD
jgi:hypothetical protein